MNLVNANVDSGAEKDKKKSFIMSSFQPYIYSLIALVLSNFNATTFHHDTCSTETYLLNCEQNHHTSYTT